MAKIVNIKAREILDSRGKPTVEVELEVQGGITVRAGVPSGASKGEREALEIRDGDPKRYNKEGVLKAIENIHKEIFPALKNMESSNQLEIDGKLIELDTARKEKDKKGLGANAILPVSLAVARASAIEQKIPLSKYLANLAGKKGNLLPVPMFNIINGGLHADNNVDFQEFMIAPVGAPSFREALRMGSETYHKLKEILKNKKLPTSVGDEGGFAPNLKSNEQAIELILEAIVKTEYQPGKDIVICLDPAASSLWEKDKNGYVMKKSDGKLLKTQDLIKIWEDWTTNYPAIWSIEDGLAEEDEEGWKKMTELIGKKIQLVGDDVFVTNPDLIQKGIKNGLANAVLIKLNQIGTIKQTLEAISTAEKANYRCVISHRSGETTDDFIADFSVGVCAGQIKTGAPCRGERVAKYNQLLRIEEELGGQAIYAGKIFSEKGKFIS